MVIARRIFWVLLVLAGAFVIVGYALPAKVFVERQISIQAAPKSVFPYLNSMRMFNTWSPWAGLDPNTRFRFEGPDSGIGSAIFWSSGKNEVGSGSQTIVASVENQVVVAELVFDGEGGSQARFLLEPEANGTKLIWRFDTDFGADLFGRYVGLLLDKMIGSSYEKGLSTLKSKVEEVEALR
jgi:hypothetical protein